MLEAYIKESIDSGRERLLLAAAVAAGKGNIDRGYDFAALAQWVSIFLKNSPIVFCFIGGFDLFFL